MNCCDISFNSLPNPKSKVTYKLGNISGINFCITEGICNIFAVGVDINVSHNCVIVGSEKLGDVLNFDFRTCGWSIICSYAGITAGIGNTPFVTPVTKKQSCKIYFILGISKKPLSCREQLTGLHLHHNILVWDHYEFFSTIGHDPMSRHIHLG